MSSKDRKLPPKLLLGISGSISVLALPQYVPALRQAGVTQVVAVMTQSAEVLLPASTVEALCDKVFTDTTGAGQHVSLARWADVTLVLPATAHLIGCVAQGLSPNLLATTLLATRTAIFAPAMNLMMWAAPAVQRNVATLAADGHVVIDPVSSFSWEVASRSIVEAPAPPQPAQLIEAMLIAGGA